MKISLTGETFDFNMRTLSKSKLISFRQCPKKLWLEVHTPKEAVTSASTEAKYATGHAVGDIARKIYSPSGRGALIDFQEGYEASYATTAKLLEGRKPIFEAAFRIPGAMCFADVLLPSTAKGQKVWRMVEVKASTSVKDYHRDDVAIQTYIAQNAGVPLKSVALAYIDNQWTYPGNDDYSGLLVEEDLTEEAFSRAGEVVQWMAVAQKVVSKSQEPDIRTGKHCKDPYPCGFIVHCASKEEIAEHPIQWLPGQLKAELQQRIENEGLTEMAQLGGQGLSWLQMSVWHCHTRGILKRDFEGAQKVLSPNKFPAYFLDFETVQFAVPIWKGTKPYQQIPFQFSLHKLGKSGKHSHEEFLDLTGKDPSKAFAEQLVEACGQRGTIYVYNASFETSRIKELAARFPRLSSQLLALIDRVVDLLPIVRDHYYSPAQKGSWSIKVVLPEICPELSYDKLSGVKDGGMAMETYRKAISPTATEAEKETYRQQLSEYCHLDTYGLMAIFNVLMAGNSSR